MNTDTIRRFKIYHYIVSALVILVFSVFYPSFVYAEGIFIPAAARVDMVYDSIRDVVYITDGASVLRYHLTSATFLPPFLLGGNLSGIDLSPDGNTLVVADRQRSDTQVWIHLVDLNTEQSSQVFFPRAFGEGGTFTVVYANDGTIFVTSTFEGSGWVPMRRYDPVSGTTTTITSVRQNTMLAASADGNTIAFAESNISSGVWGMYDVSIGTLTQPAGGTGWFNYEIGVNRIGAQYAIPTYGGTYIYDSTFNHIATLGQYAGQQPIGVVYHPTKDIVYFAWAGTNEVRGHDTTTFAEVETYDFEYTFGHTGNHAFTQGRLKISRDGRYLLGTVGGGVRVVSIGASDLTLTKSVTPSKPVAPGTPITYTLTFTNAGENTATNVVITDIVPVTLTNVSVAHQGAAITDTGFSPGFIWNVEDLAPHQGGLITITGQISSDLTSDTIFTNTAAITSSTTELNISDNQAEAGVEVALPVLSIGKTVVPETNVVYHGDVTYTIVLSNSGRADAQNVKLTDTLPVSTTFVQWVEQSGANQSSNQITWNGTVTAGQAITIALVAGHTGNYGDVVTNLAEYSHMSSWGSAQATFIVESVVPVVSIADANVIEGNSGATQAPFHVTLSVASTQTLTVTFATADGTAFSADNDYIATSGHLNFAPGSTDEIVTIVIEGDTKVEPDEIFYVNLIDISSDSIAAHQSIMANAVIADGQALGIIENDDVSSSPLSPAKDDDKKDEGAKNTSSAPASPSPVATVAPLPVSYLPETGSYDSPKMPFWMMVVLFGLGILAVWRIHHIHK